MQSQDHVGSKLARTNNDIAGTPADHGATGIASVARNFDRGRTPRTLHCDCVTRTGTSIVAIVDATFRNRIVLARQLGSSLIRGLCVIALILASGFHVADDLPPTGDSVGRTAELVVQADQDSDSAGIAVEACHICSVVSFLDASPILKAATDAPSIPRGTVLRLSMVAISIPAPPPRS